MPTAIPKDLTISPLLQLDNSATLDLNMPNVIAQGTNIGITDGVATITTVGAGIITAAALLTKNIIRSGSTAAYSDTTDTAANIIASIPNAQVGSSYEFTIVNTVAYAETLVGGTGVSLSGTTVVSAAASRNYVLKVTAIGANPTVTIIGVSGGTL